MYRCLKIAIKPSREIRWLCFNAGKLLDWANYLIKTGSSKPNIYDLYNKLSSNFFKLNLHSQTTTKIFSHVARGRRISRELFKSSLGIVNADINATRNIGGIRGKEVLDYVERVYIYQKRKSNKRTVEREDKEKESKKEGSAVEPVDAVAVAKGSKVRLVFEPERINLSRTHCFFRMDC
jgi:hypothetical protein